MNCACFPILVFVLALAGTLAAVSEDVDQVPPPPPKAPQTDDGSADLKPPPPPVNDNHYSGSSVSAEVYDPSIYPGLLPGGIPQYPDPYPAYPPPYPAPVGYAPPPPASYPAPYVVQTGYEGYLVPASAVPAAVAVSDPFSFLRGLIPSTMITWIMRSTAVLLGTITIVFMGGAMTTALCSLTPFCSISFKSLSLFNWNESAKTVGKMLGNEITPERVRRAASFVRTAIKKYSELQRAFQDADA